MKTGIAAIPGTFPTQKVLNAIYLGMPASANKWSRRKVNDLYFLYKEGVQAGYPIADEGQFKIAEYMSKNSNYSATDIRVFLYMLYDLAKTGEIAQKFWNIPLQESRTVIPDVFTSKTIDKVSGLVKWVSISALTLGVLYIALPLIGQVKNRLFTK